MIRRYTFGDPVETCAVPCKPDKCTAPLPYFERSGDGLKYSIKLDPDHKIYGLGEQVRGINKRGWSYTSWCSDEPNHTETTHSLYGAHNLLIFAGKTTFGAFFDTPCRITFDIGYTESDTCTITADAPDMDIYILDGETPYGTAREFRRLIGRSYIPPRWGFGFQQSRWGYRSADDVTRLLETFNAYDLPIDSVCLDIDYMEGFKDFTVNSERFPGFPEFVKKTLADGIHLIPIIDAGVKIENGYDIYEQGIAGGHFCKKEDGTPFVAGVWPGRTHFPDFFRPETRKWFGESYYRLTDLGIEGFWNDMNEPAIFYSDEELDAAKKHAAELFEGALDVEKCFELVGTINSLSNNPRDYRRFYHEYNGKKLRHDLVHNLYGSFMTRAASDAFTDRYPDRRKLLYSRASYIGMHRYGGIWTGDNQSWWSHLLMNIKMMPSLNMCGFLYTGADLGGFGSDSTGDLVLRWLQFGVFTPLMRNHSALGTRSQEPFRFGNIDAFRRTLQLRYRLLGYIYSEFMKAALSDDLLFKPLAFEYPEDAHAADVEDQLIFGESLMLAPVYEQNAKGRYVYLPEDMLFVKFISDETAEKSWYVEYLEDGTPIIAQPLSAGHHYIDVALDETPLFVRPNRILPLLKPANNEAGLDFSSPELLAYPHGKTQLNYRYYCDDGVSGDYNAPENHRILTYSAE